MIHFNGYELFPFSLLKTDGCECCMSLLNELTRAELELWPSRARAQVQARTPTRLEPVPSSSLGR